MNRILNSYDTSLFLKYILNNKYILTKYIYLKNKYILLIYIYEYIFFESNGQRL